MGGVWHSRRFNARIKGVSRISSIILLWTLKRRKRCAPSPYCASLNKSAGMPAQFTGLSGVNGPHDFSIGL
jgi:hypothetical protein